jgi:hypothetical protein
MKTNIVQRIEVVLGTRRKMSEQRCQSCHALAARASERVAAALGSECGEDPRLWQLRVWDPMVRVDR